MADESKLRIHVDLDATAETEKTFGERLAFNVGVTGNMVQYFLTKWLGDFSTKKAVLFGLSAIVVIGGPIGYFAYDGTPDVQFQKAKETSGVAKKTHLKSAAAKGHAEAQFILGVMALDAGGHAKDDEEAFKWFSMAATLGHKKAAFNLGLMYGNGQGTKKDVTQEAEAYKKAAPTLNEAAFNLGLMYNEGVGVDKNHDDAAFWFKQAADRGYARAANNLGVMYFKGIGVAKDEPKAVILFLKAAALGDPNAMHNLGIAHEQGKGVPKNEEAAMQWYGRAGDSDKDLSKTIAR